MSRRFGEEKNLFPISENETIFFHPQLAPLSFYWRRYDDDYNNNKSN